MNKAMRVRKVTEAVEPQYPSREEFPRYRHLVGAALLGAGMTLGACTERTVDRTAGVPAQTPRTSGKPAAVPATSSNKNADPGKQPADPPNRTLGKIKVEPTALDPTPRLMGDVAVMPKPNEVPPEEPKKD